MLLTNTEMLQQLSDKHTRHVPLTWKEKLEKLPALGIPPAVLFLVFLSRVEVNASLQPIIIAIAVGIAWILFNTVSHRAISTKQFNNLPLEEQQRRLLYDSIWHYLWRAGIGFYTVIAFTWGIIEFGIVKGQIEAALLILIVNLILAVILLFNWRWIVMVKVEGYRNHKTAGAIVSIIFGLFAALFALPRLTSVLRVTTTGETTNFIVVPFIMILLNLLTITVLVMTLLGTLITIAHFHQYWKWKQDL